MSIFVPTLKDLKHIINLVEYASSRGFDVDTKRSTQKSTVMFRDSDRIVISLGYNKHDIFYKISNIHKDVCGSIIDFVMWDQNLTIFEAESKLLTWLELDDKPIIKSSAKRKKKKSLPLEDIIKIQKNTYNKLWQIDDSRSTVFNYLKSRGITSDITKHRRFKDKLKTDFRSNILFPHFYKHDVVGMEIKNFNFSGFPGNSTKGVWFSNRFDSDTNLLLFESGIDCLSFYTLYPKYLNDSWSISTSGNWGSYTRAMLKIAFTKLDHYTVIPAFDNDNAGDSYLNSCIEIIESIDPVRASLIKPIKSSSNDWNKDLKNLKHIF